MPRFTVQVIECQRTNKVLATLYQGDDPDRAYDVRAGALRSSEYAGQWIRLKYSLPLMVGIWDALNNTTSRDEIH